ncbi:MAG: MarR family transcriptional regulator [Candidatus Saccharibacteria bacterium]
MINANHQAQDLFEELAAIKRAMQSSRGNLLSEYNLTRPQIEVLFVISHKSRQTIGELASAMGITNGGATQMIEVMVKRDLFERIADTHDRRVTHVLLTENGKALTTDLRKRHGAFMAKLLDGLGSDEMTQLVALMRKVRSCIETNQIETKSKE